VWSGDHPQQARSQRFPEFCVVLDTLLAAAIIVANLWA
jgi:hypothetical protein